jgi:hypothetical protein
MDPITGLLLITVAGIILLLGLFGVCLHYAYLAVRSQTAHEETEDRDSESAASTARGGSGDVSANERSDTGDFVFGDADERPGSGDPRQQL